MTIGESFAIVLSWQVQKSGCSNNEKFSGAQARRELHNYYFRKPPTTNPRIAHGYDRRHLEGEFRHSDITLWVQCLWGGEVDHIHTICDVRVNTSYIQSEGRFPGEGEGGIWGCDI